MEIGVIGDRDQCEEVRLKFGPGHHYIEMSNWRPVKTDVVFDFLSNEFQTGITSPVFVESSLVSLSSRFASEPDIPETVFGFCGLPTFFNRSLLEVSLFRESDKKKLIEVCGELHTDFQMVADRVGLVTPRVIAMIINEAFLTLEEGIASRADIDLAMKLGTNYPWGPFEWSDRIGPPALVKLLDAVYRDTGDERYKVCKLLREVKG